MATEGFSIKLEFATPSIVPEGKSAAAATHPGMMPLLKRMAAIIRARFTPEFYEQIVDEALEVMAKEITLDADAFTKAVNGARAARGLPILVSAEGEIEDAVAEAVRITREQIAESEEARFNSRLMAALEADRAGRTPAAEAGGYDGEPAPPRGAKTRRT